MLNINITQIRKEFYMIANKLNYGDTIGVVGVSNSLATEERKERFYRAEAFLQAKGFKIKRGKYILENFYGSCRN